MLGADVSNNMFSTKSFIASSLSMKKSHHSNTKYSMWTEIKLFPFSKTLSPRSYHSAVFHENKYFLFDFSFYLFFKKRIYVYGGYDGNSGSLSDFMQFNYSKNDHEIRWEPMPLTGLSPGKLCRHSAFFYKNRMYVFGGKKNVYLNNNDMYFYDFETKFWFQIFIDKKDKKPKKLDSFSLSLDLTTAKIIIFGGFHGKFSNKIFYFDLNENRWEKIITKGIAPEKRAGHCAVLYNDKHLYISGGGDFDQKFNDMWRFDLEYLTWQKIDTNDRIYQVKIIYLPLILQY
jgi:hypothetical protein